MSNDYIAELAKKAAAVEYTKPALVPPRTTSHSRTMKVHKQKETEDELKRSTGNVQLPQRYGRKVKKR